jgi:general stress protein YciG
MKPRTPRESAPPAPATSGLSALDRERAASVADEGGASAANLESQDKAAQARTEAKAGKPLKRSKPAAK